ncbi:hypothetical protein ACFV30_29900 [Streptomyces sp. NPDC059752]|uniref:hypothetical protein n=1 Tax=unclassified Streptomyces TaxID=2593676 RepID=UPI0036693A04
MSENETKTSVDPQLLDEFTGLIRRTAAVICAEQPDVPEPQELRELDSFSMVQVVLDLENSLEVKVLEELEGFSGATFRELAEYVTEVALRTDDADRFAGAVRRALEQDSVDSAS